ncbi:MAG: glutamate synthase subunit alpha, partial [Acidimicrobiales bacterium]|nr:glutamate synthase subunit alpha [Acidimicrobiales bacterium]
MAEEVRGYLAQLGLRSLDEAVGRVELLRQRTTGDERADALDLSPLIAPPEHLDEPRRFEARVELQDPRSDLGDEVMADAFQRVWDGDEIDLHYGIRNKDRAIGAALSGAIALEYGTLPPLGTARLRFEGSAGQSFGAFVTHGVELELVGEANDYVGKGMGGGTIVVRPPANDASVVQGSAAGSPVLAGNTCLYGATGGELFVAGSVGERFAVRNSGALAIVEGVGDHCCEYMTGGTVVVLGRVGSNLGAGMTGGQAFVWDPEAERLMSRINTDLVEAIRPEPDALVELRWLVERHVERTESLRGAELLKVWDQATEQLWHILPRERVRRIEGGAARQVSAL